MQKHLVYWSPGDLRYYDSNDSLTDKYAYSAGDNVYFTRPDMCRVEEKDIPEEERLRAWRIYTPGDV